MRRIGLLTLGPSPQLVDPLMVALQERGWVAGKNLVVETRYTQADPARAEALARELVALPVDLIVTSPTATAMAAHKVTRSVPIVMHLSGFPVEGGLAASLARPGGNVTGLAVYAGGSQLFGKFVEMLRELVPSLRELGVLWGYAPPAYTEEQVASATDELRRAAKALNVNLRFWQTGRGTDLDNALREAAHVPLGALFMTAAGMHAHPAFRSRIVDFVRERRLPVFLDAPLPLFLEAGTVAYSASLQEVADRAASFIDRILKGAKPGELPIEQPTRYELVINLKTAKELGIKVPPMLLLRADRVIE